MGLFDDAVPGGNISKPLMLAPRGALVGKMMGGFGGSTQQSPATAAFLWRRRRRHLPGGGLGGALGGGLGGLLDRFTADRSWPDR